MVAQGREDHGASQGGVEALGPRPARRHAAQAGGGVAEQLGRGGAGQEQGVLGAVEAEGVVAAQRQGRAPGQATPGRAGRQPLGLGGVGGRLGGAAGPQEEAGRGAVRQQVASAGRGVPARTWRVGGQQGRQVGLGVGGAALAQRQQGTAVAGVGVAGVGGKQGVIGGPGAARQAGVQVELRQVDPRRPRVVVARPGVDQDLKLGAGRATSP